MDLWLSTYIVVNRKLFKSTLTKQRAIASRNETCVCFAILITQISAIQFKNQHSKSILCTYIEKPSYADHQKRGIFLLILLRLLFVTRTNVWSLLLLQYRPATERHVYKYVFTHLNRRTHKWRMDWYWILLKADRRLTSVKPFLTPCEPKSQFHPHEYRINIYLYGGKMAKKYFSHARCFGIIVKRFNLRQMTWNSHYTIKRSMQSVSFGTYNSFSILFRRFCR